MKIGIVCPYNMALGGAVQEVAKESASELTKRGHEVVIITPSPAQGKPDIKECRTIFIGKASDPKSPLGTVAQVSIHPQPKEIEALLDAEKFDVLHVHEPWVPLMNQQILKRRRCPVVATFHAKLPDNITASAIKTVGGFYTKPPLEFVDSFVAVSEPALEFVGSLVGRDNVKIIPNGIPVADLRAARTGKPIRPGWKTIFYVGRHEERKGVIYLIRAFAELHRKYPKVQLLLGGKGPDTETLQKYVTDNDIKDVEFLGFLEHTEKLRLFGDSDLFAAPAMYGESFGIAPVEGLAGTGIIVAGDNPGYRSVLKELGQISLINPKDTEQFAERLELLLYNDDLRALYKTWAESYVEQFAYPKIIDQYEAIFEELVKNAKK